MTDDRNQDPDMPRDEEAQAETPAEVSDFVEIAEPETAQVEPGEAADTPAPEATAESADGAEEAPTEATPEPATSGEAAPAADGESGEAAAAEAPQRVSRRGKRNLSHGQAHIKASFNNTIIAITDLQGNAIAWTSGGSVGFKGSRKSTPYAAQVAAEQAARKAGEVGIRKLDVVVRGSGSGRETAIRTLQTMGMEVTGVKDLTPTPHNGCRPKKRRN